MASVVKRRNRYSVVYTYINESGQSKQKWETFMTNAEAKKRKVQVEFEQDSGTFIVPTAKTIADLLEEHMSIYGVNTWAMSTYEARRSLIFNYINPLIGNMKLEDVTPRTMDKFYLSLRAVKTKVVNNRIPKKTFLTPKTIREIHKLLRCAFNQAVRWELISRNPVINATLPKEAPQERNIWTADILFKALEVCDDDNLALALNIAFSCSTRMGELLGLTWDSVDISEESIREGRAFVYINKELQRVTREALKQLGEKGVIFKFPPVLSSTHTTLVLKEPKTKTSVRKVFLPQTVAEMLVKHREEMEKIKDLFGDEYTDYNLVFATTCGRPLEGQIINRALKKLIQDNDFPPVVFHSLRHSSITYKLKLNGGDMKSVQGDSGHAQVKMVADVYSHIIDDDRRVNAQRFEEQFYQSKVEQVVEEVKVDGSSEETVQGQEAIMKLLANSEMATLLKSLAKNL